MCAQFLWETKARVLIDFTPGAGMMAKSAAMLSIKMVLVTHNELHSQALTNILVDFIVADFKAQANYAMSKFAPSDVTSRIEGLKPERLVKFLAQKKRAPEGDAAGVPDAKRSALASTMENYLGSLDGGSPKPKPKAEAKSEAVPPKAAQAKAPSVAPIANDCGASSTSGPVAESPPAKAGSGAAAPTEDLAALLKQWSS